jgi:hypothetical protein
MSISKDRSMIHDFNRLAEQHTDLVQEFEEIWDELIDLRDERDRLHRALHDIKVAVESTISG